MDPLEQNCQNKNNNNNNMDSSPVMFSDILQPSSPSEDLVCSTLPNGDDSTGSAESESPVVTDSQCAVAGDTGVEEEKTEELPLTEDGGAGDNGLNGSGKRRVKFPEDEGLVTDYFVPVSHWQLQQAATPTNDQLIADYKMSCDKHQVRPIPTLLEQLKGINISLCNDRYNMLTLRGVKLDSRSVETLEEVFKSVQFKTLDFENTNLDDDMAISLFDMVEYYESCTKLNIGMNSRITQRGFQTCSRMMKKTQCLENLDLHGILFADVSMPALGRALRLGCPLRVLRLENSNVCARNLVVLVSALKLNEQLRELYLANNRMMPTDGIQLGGLLKVNHRLQLLDVRNNSLGDVGVSHLCDGLYEQVGETGLVSLVLWCNSITHLAMPALSQALKRCRQLQNLNLGNNPVSSEGAHYLREGLLANRTLLRVSLPACKISCEGAVALAEYIADTRQLLRMDLRENDIRTGGMMALALALKVNRSVTRLDLDRDSKRDPGVKDYQHAQRELLLQIEEHLRRNKLALAELDRQKMVDDQIFLQMETSSIDSGTSINHWMSGPPASSHSPSPSSSPRPSQLELLHDRGGEDQTGEDEGEVENCRVATVENVDSAPAPTVSPSAGCSEQQTEPIIRSPSPRPDDLAQRVLSPTDVTLCRLLRATPSSCEESWESGGGDNQNTLSDNQTLSPDTSPEVVPPVADCPDLAERQPHPTPSEHGQ